MTSFQLNGLSKKTQLTQLPEEDRPCNCISTQSRPWIRDPSNAWLCSPISFMSFWPSQLGDGGVCGWGGCNRCSKVCICNILSSLSFRTGVNSVLAGVLPAFAENWMEASAPGCFAFFKQAPVLTLLAWPWLFGSGSTLPIRSKSSSTLEV